MEQNNQGGEKSKIEFGETERSVLATLSGNVAALAGAIDRLTQQVMVLAEKA